MQIQLFFKDDVGRRGGGATSLGYIYNTCFSLISIIVAYFAVVTEKLKYYKPLNVDIVEVSLILSTKIPFW